MLDDMTFVYYDNGQNKNLYQDLQHAFIQNETKNNLLKVTSDDLAKHLKLEHGKFYCYYKPSFVNYDED